MADKVRKGDIEVRIVDEDQNAVKIDSSGRLLVSQEAATPADTTEVIKVAQTSINSDTDTLYTITNGKTLTLQIFDAGAEANATAGSKVSLYEDPNGNLSVLNLITVLYVNGTSAEASLSTSFEGNGTRRIVMRRSSLGGGNREVFGRWKGFEQ